MDPITLIIGAQIVSIGAAAISEIRKGRNPFSQRRRYVPQHDEEPEGEWRPPTVEERWGHRWFHGTKDIGIAAKIMSTHEWYVEAAHGNPVGLYVTKKFSEAAKYSSMHGAVLVVDIEPGVPVRKLNNDSSNGYHYVPVPKKKTYFNIRGVTPIAMLSQDGADVPT